MILQESKAREIINLNPYGVIDNEISERQFKVIVKGFNHLIQEENNFLYIADEVGLGKTYVALGIASLLRHFCSEDRRTCYKDLILVPKRNLQHKWVKEINNFITHNYKLECNIVKSVLGKSVGECSDKNIHDNLEPFSLKYPSYEIFRNSTFSIGSSETYDWKGVLYKSVRDDLKPVFKRGIELYIGDKEIYLKRLYAFLQNISFPKVDLLIVDEAHNFKHGIGEDVSYRNQLVSRLMGVVQPEDEIIFNDFPELKEQISHKANKVIFLSATPIDNGLYEIKNQFDCFLPNHRFKNVENINDVIKNELNTFMIRGLMKIKLENENKNNKVSRNMYRHEHRRGNVDKVEEAKPQIIEDELESLIIGLMQFKTLEHLNESSNNSFEMGMLAGFESFSFNKSLEKEYEETASRSIKQSEDQNIIKHIAESYFKEFNSYLPHPKQDNLIKVLLNGIRKGEKSLVFVRRIATVIELERKLNLEIEQLEFEKIEKYLKNNPRLNTLSQAFKDRHQIVEIENVINSLASRLFNDHKNEWSNSLNNENNPVEIITDILLTQYNSEYSSEDLNLFRELLKGHLKRINFSKEFKDVAKNIVSDYLLKLTDNTFEKSEYDVHEFEDEFNAYFFSTYFGSKRYPDGFNFRKRAGIKDWYRFNFFYLKDFIQEINDFSSTSVMVSFNEKDKVESRRMDVANEKLIELFENKSIPNLLESSEIFSKKTFFNLLFEQVLNSEFREWLNEKWRLPSKGYSFYEDFDALLEIVQGVFRNGSGLLPAYTAEHMVGNVEQNLLNLLKNDYPEVISELKTILIDFDKIMSSNFSNRSRIQRTLYNQNPICGVSGNHKRDVSRVATQFRMPGYPYVLITTDILKEGEDLHLYCKDVYHYGIAWNPSDMEQRTGRIDRINSQCYFELKDEGSINFNNALQVFYPYLADTLEVNQVAKVFNKMDDFIQTFYDISVKREKDSIVSTDKIVEEIPLQIKTELVSKFDFENFRGYSDEGQESLEIVSDFGLNKEDLIERLNHVFDLIRTSFNFFIPPKFSLTTFSLNAVVKLLLEEEERRAPLNLSIITHYEDGDLVFQIDSIICRSMEIKENSKRKIIQENLNEFNLKLISDSNFLYVRKNELFSVDDEELKKSIELVLKRADLIEAEYTQGGDLSEV